MSNVIKLQSSNKKLQLKVNQGVEDTFSDFDSAEKRLNERLELEYQKGYEDAVKELKEKLSDEYDLKLDSEIAKMKDLLKSIDEELKNYEEQFSEIVISLALSVSKKILQHEIDRNSPLLENIGSVTQKMIGANYLIIKANPEEIHMLKERSNELFSEGNFSKIKFEEDIRVEKGGFIIESDIGNIDGQISSQLNEIKKAIGNLSIINKE